MQVTRNLLKLTSRSIVPNRRLAVHSRHVCTSAMAPEWRQKLERALTNNKDKMPYAKYYQVATVRPDGSPANRTVVHRGFYGDLALTWVTDIRSSKVKEVAKDPRYEAAWYFEDSREQFRISGTMEIVGKEHSNSKLVEERQRVWSSLSPGGRGQFTYPDPGLPRQPGDEDQFKQEAPPEDSNPVDVFNLVVMDVDEVDYLNLFDTVRIEYRSSKGSDGQREWSSKNVNP